MNCKTLAALTSWLISDKKLRSEFREFCKNLDDKKNCEIIHARYHKVIAGIKAKKGKINVVFLVNDNSKWSYDYVYEQFAKNEKYNVTLLVTVSEYLLKKRYSYMNYKKILQDNYEFFKKNGFNVQFAFDMEKNRYIDLKIFNPDIIFYAQPWDLPEIHSIYNTSKYALAMYCSYGSCITNGENEYCKPFFNELHTYFVDNEEIISTMKSHGINSVKLECAGQVKLDAYLKPVNEKNIIWKSTGKKRVIYAPHHSFYENSMLGFGTFDWNYRFFLEYAKKHEEFEFILKPHPELKCQIVKNKLMTYEDMEKYFESWKNLPNCQIYEKGGYFDMFRTSDLMITDCNSFLYEYLPCEKPVIHLISSRSAGHNKFGQKITAGYYDVHDIKELEETLFNVLECSQDKYLERRKDIIKNVFNKAEGGTASHIMKYVENLLSKENI